MGVIQNNLNTWETTLVFCVCSVILAYWSTKKKFNILTLYFSRVIQIKVSPPPFIATVYMILNIEKNTLPSYLLNNISHIVCAKMSSMIKNQTQQIALSNLIV